MCRVHTYIPLKAIGAVSKCFVALRGTTLEGRYSLVFYCFSRSHGAKIKLQTLLNQFDLINQFSPVSYFKIPLNTIQYVKEFYGI